MDFTNFRCFPEISRKPCWQILKLNFPCKILPHVFQRHFQVFRCFPEDARKPWKTFLCFLTVTLSIFATILAIHADIVNNNNNSNHHHQQQQQPSPAPHDGREFNLVPSLLSLLSTMTAHLSPSPYYRRGLYLDKKETTVWFLLLFIDFLLIFNSY